MSPPSNPNLLPALRSDPPAPPVASPSNFRRIAQLLHALRDDGLSTSVKALPECPRFYAPAVYHQAAAQLDLALASGAFCYFLGAVEGVGLSTYLADEAAMARDEAPGTQTPILYWRLNPSSARPSKLVRSISHRLGAPISHAAVRLEDTSELAEGILEALRTHRVRLVVVDHAHYLSLYAKAVLEDLMWATDPKNTRGLPGPQQPQRISFIFISHLHPAYVLGDRPGLAARVDLSPTVVEPYRLEDIAAVLPQVGLSWGAVDLHDADDRSLVEAIYDVTKGHVSRMNPLFRAMLAVRQPLERPGRALVQHALCFSEGVSELHRYERGNRERRWGWESDTDYWIEAPRPRPMRSAPAAEQAPPKEPKPSERKARKRAEDAALARSVRDHLAVGRRRSRRSAR